MGRYARLALSLLVLSGCATVRIESGIDAVRVERYWGVLALRVGEPTGSHVAEVTSLGFAHTAFGWSAGYSHQAWAAMGEECRLVVWVTALEHLDAARKLMRSEAGVCVASFSSAPMEVRPDERDK